MSMPKQPAPLYAEIERPLREDEIHAPSSEVAAPELKRLSQRHHHLARLLAEGFSPAAAALAAGYALSRVSILQADPMFKELVRHYKIQADSAFLTVQQKLADIAGLAADEITDRLENHAGEMDLEDLKDLLKLAADRTGNGPAQGNNLTLNFTNIGARLDAAAARMKLVEGSVDEST